MWGAWLYQIDIIYSGWGNIFENSVLNIKMQKSRKTNLVCLGLLMLALNHEWPYNYVVQTAYIFLHFNILLIIFEWVYNGRYGDGDFNIGQVGPIKMCILYVLLYMMLLLMLKSFSFIAIDQGHIHKESLVQE